MVKGIICKVSQIKKDCSRTRCPLASLMDLHAVAEVNNLKKLTLMIIGIIVVISIFQSCKTLNVRTNSAVFFEMTRRYETIDGHKELVYIEPFGGQYYYHVSITLKNATKNDVYIDLNSCKLKIGNEILPMKTCVNGKGKFEKIDTLIIKPNEKILLDFFRETEDLFVIQENFSLYQDFFTNFSEYREMLNENTILEFECSGGIISKIEMPIKTFVTYNEESEISNFFKLNRCNE
jgi:hypothetical protein